MKCEKCGAQIKKGNLYCSACGTEVQIVSAYHVMEEEFFLDFQKREMHEGAGGVMVHANRSQADSFVNRRGLIFGWILAVASALCLALLGICFFSPEHTVAEADASLVQTDPTQKSLVLAWECEKQSDTAGQIEALYDVLELDRENYYACRELIRIYVANQDFDALHDFYVACEGTSLEKQFRGYVVDAPKIELPQEPFLEIDSVTISAEKGCNIYYTVDGSSPISNGTLYFEPFTLDAGSYTLEAVSCNELGYYSTVTTCTLTVAAYEKPGMPQVTPASGEFTSPQTIYITVPDGCSAYYTWNGQTPTEASTRYNGGISMPEGNNVLSVLIIDAYGFKSSIQRMNYIYMPG